MIHLLRIDSSSRLQGSHSRELADYFQTIWLEKHPQDRVLIRDFAKTSLPHISDMAIAGFYTSREQQTEEMKMATALSDELIDELHTADILLISVPMYNFSVPSVLKAWIDRIVRIGRTFAYDGTNFTELVKVQRAYIVCTYGASGYTAGKAFAAFNFLEPYLRGLFSFLGIPEIHFFNLEGTTEDEATVAQNTQEIKQAIFNTISAI
ncbi:MAG: NAD(P)H-dependent oxidoreductase [Pleurocapsa sp. MO_226.B13]|nr:NAD(P)H-dependent oxidoreductase [Pleurocapsa sp. MO_226.B13]